MLKMYVATIMRDDIKRRYKDRPTIPLSTKEVIEVNLYPVVQLLSAMYNEPAKSMS